MNKITIDKNNTVVEIREIINKNDVLIKKYNSIINIELKNAYIRRKHEFKKGIDNYKNKEIEINSFKLFLYIYRSIFKDLDKIINRDIPDEFKYSFPSFVHNIY